MKKYRFYGGLLVPLSLIITSCSYLTNNVKNTNDYSPHLEQTKHAQAQLLPIHTIPDKKSSQLLRFLKNYKRKISNLLRFLRLWNNHRPDRKTIQLEDWKQNI